MSVDDFCMRAFRVREFCPRAGISGHEFYLEVSRGAMKVSKRGQPTARYPDGKTTLVAASELLKYME